MDKQDELAAVIAKTFHDWGQGRDADFAPMIAAAIRSFMGSDEAVERVATALAPHIKWHFSGTNPDCDDRNDARDNAHRLALAAIRTALGGDSA